MPSQRMKIGTQAIDGMARSAWMDGSSSRRASLAGTGQHAEHGAGERADAEAERDPRHGRRDMGLQFAGGGSATAVCSEARRRRHQPARCDAGAHRDFPGHAKRYRYGQRGEPAAQIARRHLSSRRASRGIRHAPDGTCVGRIDHPSVTAVTSTSAGQHAGLLQRLAGLDDRFRLCLADHAAGQIGALQLPRDHRVRTASSPRPCSAFSSAGCSTDQRRARS